MSCINMRMFDFIRLLELSGIKFLLEDLTPGQARGIFKQYGANDADLSPDKIRATWIKLVRQMHPDKTGGDHQPLAMINAAYDVLKAPASATVAKDDRGFPAWQTDQRSTRNDIATNDYTDVNFFKKRMWELSGKSQEKWTIYAFDGTFFRGMVTVFGSSRIFRDMAKAMVIHNSRGGNPHQTRAVFVQDDTDPDIILIWLDGNEISPPIPMEHESRNRNPANDLGFTSRLSKVLNQISSGRD